MNEKNNVDFGSVAEDYARWNNDFPLHILDKLLQKGIIKYNYYSVDLGSGSGLITREMTKKGLKVIGVEPSIELIKEAKKIDEMNGLNINYINAKAEDINLPDEQIEIVTVVRAWHWFERIKVISEIKRILKPNGYLIIMDSGFIPHKSKLVQDTLELIRKYTPDRILKPSGSKAETQERRNGFPITWYADWEEANFKIIENSQEKYKVSFSHDGWRGRVRALSWLSTFEQEIRNKIDLELVHLLEKNYPNEPLIMPHIFSMVVLQK